MKQKIVIIGGGAAGFFAAISMAEKNQNLQITILEKSDKVLQKVKVSGGGRCNVTHACFTPSELVEFYPRGKKELLGPFHRFMTGDAMEWFENHGVPLKIETDNRVFPVSDSSQDIINCLTENAKRNQIKVKLNQNVIAVKKQDNRFLIKTDSQNDFADQLLIATGSNPKMWNIIEDFGHKVIAPVPSLFTFKISDERIRDIPGVSVNNAIIEVENTKFIAQGPVLITHWGLSGPAILKLSSFGALFLAQNDYHFQVKINWLSKPFKQVNDKLRLIKKEKSVKYVFQRSPFETIPKRLWEKLVTASRIKNHLRWADLTNRQIEDLSEQLSKGIFKVEGKSVFKDEFVTAGGVDLKEINFKRFESKIHNNLYFAGEVLNIDAVTGGFNFQNAWTGGFIAGESIATQ